MEATKFQCNVTKEILNIVDTHSSLLLGFNGQFLDGRGSSPIQETYCVVLFLNEKSQVIIAAFQDECSIVLLSF